MQSSRTTSAPLLLDVAVTHLAVNSCQKGEKVELRETVPPLTMGCMRRLPIKLMITLIQAAK